MTLAPTKQRDALAEKVAAARDRFARHPVVAGVASGFLLWTVVSAGGVELAGLDRAGAALLAGDSAGSSPFKTYLAAWLGGLVFWLLALEWLRCSTRAPGSAGS